MANRRTPAESLIDEEEELDLGTDPGEDDPPPDEDEDELSDDPDEDPDVDDEDDDDEDDEEEDTDSRPARTQDRSRRQTRQSQTQQRSIEEIQRAVDEDGPIYAGELSRLRAYNQSTQARLQNARKKRADADKAWSEAPSSLLTEIEQTLSDHNIRLTDGVKRFVSRTIADKLSELGKVAGDAETVGLHDALDRVLLRAAGSNVTRQQTYARMTLEEKMEEVMQVTTAEAARKGQSGRRAQNLNGNTRRVQGAPATRKVPEGRTRMTESQLLDRYGEGTLRPADEARAVKILQARGLQ